MIKKAKLTRMEYALLGLISLKSSSGYDIHRIFADTPMIQYSSSPGSIYPALARLEDRHQLSSTLDRKLRMSTRRRRLYQLTALGNETLDAWLAEKPSLAEIKTDVRTTLLRFSLMENRRSTTAILEFLNEFKANLRLYVKELEELRRKYRLMNASHAYLAIDNGVRSIRTHIRWTDATIKSLS